MKDVARGLFDQQKIRQSFRRGLQSYNQHAEMQAQIAETLARLLAEAGAPSHFGTGLEFGCGTGFLTERLRQRFSIGHLTLNDLVPESETYLRRFCGDPARGTRFVAGSIETIELPDNLNLIASASTVQWLSDIPSLMERFADQLAPGGWLALSGFGHEQFAELQALGSNAAAPGYVDGEEWKGLLPDSMELILVRQDRQTMQFRSAQSLLNHLRKTGVNGQSGMRWTRSRLTDFKNRYRAQFSKEGMLTLTYDPVWVIARKHY